MVKKEKSKGWEWGSWWGGIKLSLAKIALILKKDGDKSMFQFVFEMYTKKEERSCLFHRQLLNLTLVYLRSISYIITMLTFNVRV